MLAKACSLSSSVLIGIPIGGGGGGTDAPCYKYMYFKVNKRLNKIQIV